MRRATSVPVLVMTLALAACGSSTGVATTPATATSSAASATTAAPFSASPVSTAGLTCKDFDKAAPDLLSALHALAQYINGGGDAGPNLSELSAAMGVLSVKAPECAPRAVDSLATMASAVATVEDVYGTGRDPATIATDKEALDAVKAAGLLAWKAMGLDLTAWDYVLHYYF